MSHDDFQQLKEGVEANVKSNKKIEEALLGTLTNPNGVLQNLSRFMHDFYRPDDPSKSVFNRLAVIEEREQRRAGWMAAAGTFGGLVAWALNYFFGK